MSGGIRNPWRGMLTAFVVVSLLFSSGCALLLVGAGGAGGYMIRKGEEGDKPAKKESFRLEEKSPVNDKVGSMAVTTSKGKALQEVALRLGDTP